MEFDSFLHNLPDDMADAFDGMRLAIMHQRHDGWRAISLEDTRAMLTALDDVATDGEGKRLNLDHDEARAVHRIIRAMHDGECPKCHVVSMSDKMHAIDKYHDAIVWSGLRCPWCKFQISDEEASAAIKLFAPFMEANLAVFEKWRAELA